MGNVSNSARPCPSFGRLQSFLIICLKRFRLSQHLIDIPFSCSWNSCTSRSQKMSVNICVQFLLQCWASRSTRKLIAMKRISTQIPHQICKRPLRIRMMKCGWCCCCSKNTTILEAPSFFHPRKIRRRMVESLHI